MLILIVMLLMLRDPWYTLVVITTVRAFRALVICVLLAIIINTRV